MLTVLQFHSDKPHETVLNIPLELAGLDHSPLDFSAVNQHCGQGVMHTIGDPWLDLRVVTSSTGVVCICHHYVYKSRAVQTPIDPSYCQVFFAYSITLLHHGCVLHCVVPNVSLAVTQNSFPSYTLQDHYLMVLVPGICMHLLDIGLDHSPSCHIIGGSPDELMPNAQLFLTHSNPQQLVTAKSLNFIDLNNNLRIEVKITKESLFTLFKNTECFETKKSILHMTAVHYKDHDLVRKLMWKVCESSYDLEVSPLIKEYLIGVTYTTVLKHLDNDAVHLLSLLPITTSEINQDQEYWVNEKFPSVRVSYCALENASIMLLAPRERLKGSSDTWSKLWQQTSVVRKTRFDVSQVVEKLMVSLDNYKPETLSQGCTPLSPASPLVGGITISSLGLTLAHLMFDPLPFSEQENTTSSKLEHLLSVNLRELSMFCLKQFTSESPLRVHAVASKFVCTQLQVSRRLCSILCASQALVPKEPNEKGFSFVNNLSEGISWRLFTLLERYYLAADEVAFPLPQGFNSFFAYLGFKCLPHHVLMQYVNRGVFVLNVDVLRQILFDLDDRDENTRRKIEILECVPRVRALRALQFWRHPDSVLIRARNHAEAILTGENSSQKKGRKMEEFDKDDIFAELEATSPYESFLELLSAKANHTDLDLNLLHAGTKASLEHAD